MPEWHPLESQCRYIGDTISAKKKKIIVFTVDSKLVFIVLGYIHMYFLISAEASVFYLGCKDTTSQRDEMVTSELVVGNSAFCVVVHSCVCIYWCVCVCVCMCLWISSVGAAED